MFMRGDRSGRPHQQHPYQRGPHSQDHPHNHQRYHDRPVPATSLPVLQQPPRNPRTVSSPTSLTPQRNPPPVLNIQNVANTCYAVSVVQVLCGVGLQRCLLPGTTPLNSNLTNLLNPILGGGPTTPQFDLVNLVMALNMCVQGPNMFDIGRQQCAGEFLTVLLSNLSLGPHFSTFKEEATCQLCQTTESVNLPTATTPHILVLPITHSQVAADVAPIVRRILGNNNTLLTCQNPTCFAYGNVIPSTFVFTEHRVTIYWLNRNVFGQKPLTSLIEPDSADWNGRQCTALLAHEGIRAVSGHWIAFIKYNGSWWRVDSNRPSVTVEDPFANQMDANNTNGNYTIDVLFFT